MIEFKLLGPLELRSVDGRDLGSVLSQPKRLALLAYLAIAARGAYCRRDTLLALFWPELDDHRARRALNQAIYVLRQDLGRDALVVRGEEEIGLDAARLWCDATAFDALIAQGRPDDALALYRGELLQGSHLSDSPAFERWLDQERSRLGRRAVAAALTLEARELAAGNRAGRVHWLREATRLDPYDESTVRRLLAALVETGDRTGALREYEAFRLRLDRELSVEPASDLVREAERIRKSASGPRPVDWSPGVATSGPPPVTRSRKQLPRIAVAIAVVLALATVGYAGVRLNRGANDGGPRRVVVLEFDNLTGDSALAPLGRIAADWVAEGLARAGLIEVIPPAALLRREERAAIRRAPPGSGLMVAGSLVRRGDSLHFQGQITGANGELLRAVSVTAPTSDPLAGVEALRSQVTGALATIVDPRLASWARAASQPPSLETYVLYSDGLGLLTQGRWVEAGRALKQAAARDSGFTSPLLWAAYAYHSEGDFVRQDSLLRLLEPRSELLPAWDRAMLGFLAGRLAGDQEAAYQAIRRLADLAPGSEWLYLLGAQALFSNRPAEAVEVLGRLTASENPLASRLTHRWLAEAQHRLGDYEAELATADRGRRLGLSIGPLARLRALAALGKVSELETTLDEWLASRPRDYASGNVLWNVLAELRLRDSAMSERLTARALQWYRAATPEERNSVNYRERLAQLLLLAEQDHEARELFEGLLRDIPVRSHRPEDRQPAHWIYLGGLGVLAARRGDTAQALTMSQLIERHRDRWDYGEGTVWRAAIAARLGDLAGGTALFRNAMAEGLFLMNEVFIRPDLASLRQYPAFQELTRAR